MRDTSESLDRASADAPQPAPRAVIRLLRSGSLTEERARRVLEVHGTTVQEWSRITATRQGS